MNKVELNYVAIPEKNGRSEIYLASFFPRIFANKPQK